MKRKTLEQSARREEREQKKANKLPKRMQRDNKRSEENKNVVDTNFSTERGRFIY